MPTGAMFPKSSPDPYALSNPAAALAHYVGGSGEDRNYYFNTLDTSKLALSDFPEIQRTPKEGTPGLHQIVNASGRFDSGLPVLTRNLSSAATIGGPPFARTACWRSARTANTASTGCWPLTRILMTSMPARDDPR